MLYTGGHLDVVRLLVEQGSDVDSQDNRKVSCLMAAFRKVGREGGRGMWGMREEKEREKKRERER